MKAGRIVKPWVFGIAAGALLVGADAALRIAPPSAYAFCLSCHARDLVNTVVNALAGTRWQVTEVASRALLLTSPGVIAGAFLAARLAGERKARRADRPVLFAALGFLVMTVGILIFGCPTRIVLRAGYGEFYGLAALAGLLAGTAVATVAMILRMRAGGGGR
jgi:hypothetical protein